MFGLPSYDGPRFGTALELRWYEGGTIDNDCIEGEISRDGINTNNVLPTLYTNLTLDYDFAAAGDNSVQGFFRDGNLFNKAPPFPVSGGERSCQDATGRTYRAEIHFRL